VINIGNFTWQDKPPWEGGQQIPPPAPRWPRPDAGDRRAARAGPGAGAGAALGLAVWVVFSWLATLPRRLGDRLFQGNDAEAYQWDWQITRTHAGLGRCYRDPRFDKLAECSWCLGAGVADSKTCLLCEGTGRTAQDWTTENGVI
jgi:hypothetical protein